MKRIVAIVAIIVIAGAGWLLFGGKNNNEPNNNQAGQTNTPSRQANTNTESPAAIATNKVSIADMAFSPAKITIKAGTTVTWTNNDSVAHTVTESDGQDGPGSSPISPGQSYSFTFQKAGTYAYICTIHASMSGSVTVTQ